MLVAATMALGVAIGWLRGGRLARLEQVNLRAVPLLGLAAAAQVLVFLGAADAALSARRGLLGAAHAGALGFLWANRRLPGAALIAVGTAANALVTVANGAMPVSARALRTMDAEIHRLPAGRHVLADSVGGGARLPWLADMIPLPVLETVVSVGDVLLAAGAGVLLSGLMTRPATGSSGRSNPGWMGSRDRTPGDCS